MLVDVIFVSFRSHSKKMLYQNAVHTESQQRIVYWLTLWNCCGVRRCTSCNGIFVSFNHIEKLYKIIADIRSKKIAIANLNMRRLWWNAYQLTSDELMRLSANPTIWNPLGHPPPYTLSHSHMYTSTHQRKIIKSLRLHVSVCVWVCVVYRWWYE